MGFQTYIWAGVPTDPLVELAAAASRLPTGAVFAGRTAAWLHGLDVPPCGPIEVIVPEELGISARAGLHVHRREIARPEIVLRAGFPTSAVLRTLADLARSLPLVEAVVVADEALHRRLTTVDDLRRQADAMAGRRGSVALREVAHHAEPKSESPMETRLRMTLVLRGLPRPEAQPRLRDRWGRLLGRPDLYSPEHLLGLEYDGGTHRQSLVEDNRRQNRMTNAGIRLLRFTYADVMHHPDAVAAAVAEALRAAA